MFTPHSVCHTEKKSEEKSEYLLPAAPNKPVAPLFLQGLSDLQVMDGSQVTMTVQVSGLPRLSPLGIRENGPGCNMGIAPQHPAQLIDPSENQPETVSQWTCRNEASWPLVSAFSGQDFLDSRLNGSGGERWPC